MPYQSPYTVRFESSFSDSQPRSLRRILQLLLIVGRRQRRLLRPVPLVLYLAPVRRRRLVAVRLAHRAAKRRRAAVQLVALVAVGRPVARTALVRHRHVAPEPLAHVHHAALALAKALLQLLAFSRELRGQRLAEAVGRPVALHHDAVGFLEALGQRIAWEG